MDRQRQTDGWRETDGRTERDGWMDGRADRDRETWRQTDKQKMGGITGCTSMQKTYGQTEDRRALSRRMKIQETDVHTGDIQSLSLYVGQFLSLFVPVDLFVSSQSSLPQYASVQSVSGSLSQIRLSLFPLNLP